MEQVIKLAEYYLDLGYSIQDAITMAININRQKYIELYEIGGIDEINRIEYKK